MNRKRVQLLSLVLAGLMLFGSCSRKNRESGENAQGGMTAEEIMALKSSPVEPDLVVDGVAYAKKKDVKTVLFMGIDKTGDLETTDHTIGGQSDTLLLLVVDGEEKKQTILQLDRDTMTEVEVLDYYGKPTGFSRVQQLCLSHTYGQGDEKSCENTVRAVSRLLMNTPVDGYVSLLFEAIPDVNDAVGGVEVTIADDLSSSDPALALGKTVTLKGNQALTYVRARMSVGDGTNVSRMRRQREYLSSLGKLIRGKLKTDSSVINDLYSAAEPFMISDMTLSDLTSVAVEGSGYTDAGILTPSGEHAEVTYQNGNTHVEFHPDEDSILETVLTLFYRPIS
ncbi:MAG: hypothetical protein E7576_09000 [Ruminococcaceae bacterium]|jgi:LCP family protein required for cell wall assembly|nr:hypothetical protein [Oscillospiraceae bacterium]